MEQDNWPWKNVSKKEVAILRAVGHGRWELLRNLLEEQHPVAEDLLAEANHIACIKLDKKCIDVLCNYQNNISIFLKFENIKREIKNAGKNEPIEQLIRHLRELAEMQRLMDSMSKN